METKTLNLYQKIIEVKKTIKNFTKDNSTTGYGAYKYTSGTQILSAIKDKMEEVGLILMPVETKHEDAYTYNYTTKNGEKTDFVVRGVVKYQWINADKPEERQEVDWAYYGQQNDISKAFGLALTYSERYLLLKSLGVPTDEDDPDKITEEKACVKTEFVNKENVNIIKKALEGTEIEFQEITKWALDYYKEKSIDNLNEKEMTHLLSIIQNRKDKKFKEELEKRNEGDVRI